MHDAARKAEVTDRWDKQSSELCSQALQQLFELDIPMRDPLSKMIEYKDDPESYHSLLTALGCSQDLISSWNYLRELLHDADCLDIMRVRKNFDLRYLDLLKHVKHPIQSKAILALVLEIKDLLSTQGDLYKDLTIQHPFSEEKLCFAKHFSCETKARYEHAPLVFSKVLEDMLAGAWLKTAVFPIERLLFHTQIPAISYPKEILQDLYTSLVAFEKDDCRIFHGGPIDHAGGPRWVMPAIFSNSESKIRRAFEIVFINCLPFDGSCKDACVHQVFLKDLDLKTKNTSIEAVKVFYDLLDSKSSSAKTIILRETDILNVCYPSMYNCYLFTETKESDQHLLLSSLNELAGTKLFIQTVTPLLEVSVPLTLPFQGIIERKKIVISLSGSSYSFFVEHYLNSLDTWGSYYVFTLAIPRSFDAKESMTLRLDSGCNSGMVYLDTGCSCQRELEEGLLGLIKEDSHEALLIHIPAHEGRGMGMAPKAETEIYKRGGKGKLNTTPALSAIEAAHLLYKSDLIDIRTFDGAVSLLKRKNIKHVNFISRSLLKKSALEKAGIVVTFA
jgi:GTP cyclohydrolase II